MRSLLQAVPFSVRRRSFSLRTRLLVSYLAVTVLVLVTVNLLVMAYFEQSAYNQRRTNLNGHARVVAGVSSQYIMQGHDYLEYIARDYGDQVGARVVIMDRAGVVLRDSFYEQAMLGQRLAEREEVAAALSGRPRSRLLTVEGAGRTLYTAAPIFRGEEVTGAVLLVQVVESAWTELQPVRTMLYLVSGAALLLASGAAWWLAASLARPVSLITQGVRAVQEGNLSHRVPVLQQDEIGRLAEAFNAMTGRLDQIEQSRRVFVADAAHELRTPLAALKALTEPLLAGAVTPEEQREFLEDIGQEVDRLSELAQDLLTLSEQEAGRPLHREPVRLDQLLDRVRSRLQPLARNQRVEVRVTAPATVLKADERKLERAFYNLVHNALSFSPPGSAVSVTAEEHAGGIRVLVADRGPGIPAVDLPSIFERFYRSERSRSRQHGGAGLGLAIVREIVQAHGGQVRVESTVGEGTIFAVQLPQ